MLEIDLNSVLSQLSPEGVKEWELAVVKAENIAMKEYIDSLDQDDLGQDDE
tara:strand:+ start:182 stop:334 length:153 start_codon:yes stop_codon:yes gene_type:complete